MDSAASREISGLRLAAQYEVARLLAEARSIAEVAPAILSTICNYLRWDVGAFWLVRDHALYCRHFYTRPSVRLSRFDHQTMGTHLSPGEGLPGRIWQTQRLVWIPDLQSDSNFPRLKGASEDGLRCAIGVPIRILDEVFGVLEFFSRILHKTEDASRESLESIASQVGQFLLRKQNEERLRESEELFRTITDIAPFGIITIDDQSTIVAVNPAVEQIFGYSAKELLGRNLTVLMPPAFAERHKAGIARYIQTGEKRISWRAVPLTGQTRDGKLIDIEISFGESTLRGRRHFTGFVVARGTAALRPH
jgi:PAS domain S-box-containing protein